MGFLSPMTSSRKLRFSAQARRDLRAILQYSTETWGREQGDAYAASLQEAMRHLADYPAVGRAREDIRPDLRSFQVRQHLVLYRADDKAVVVLRVLHARMDVRAALDEIQGSGGE